MATNHHPPATANLLETLPTLREDEASGSSLDGAAKFSSDAMHARHRTTTLGSSASRIVGVRSAMGLHPHAPVDEAHDAQEHHHQLFWPRVRLALREPFAEFSGVFVMVMFGNGSVAQVLLSEKDTSAPGGHGFGGYQSISWGWGIGVALGIWVAGDSGAYLNPAITFANCLYRGLPWRRFPVYMLAQFLGGFVASAVVYANYVSSINNFAGHGVRTSPPATTATAGIFCTFPAGTYLNKTNQFFSEFISSFLLIFVIFALKDGSNTGGIRGDGNWFPLALFFLIFGLGASFGYQTGYALNFARDFGPRLMAAILGYSDVWSAYDYYFWVPIVAPFAGCTVGAGVYDLLCYTGPESPINSPWLGIPYLFRPRRALARRWEQRAQEIPGGAQEGFVGPNKVDDEAAV